MIAFGDLRFSLIWGAVLLVTVCVFVDVAPILFLGAGAVSGLFTSGRCNGRFSQGFPILFVISLFTGAAMFAMIGQDSSWYYNLYSIDDTEEELIQYLMDHQVMLFQTIKTTVSIVPLHALKLTFGLCTFAYTLVANIVGFYIGSLWSSPETVDPLEEVEEASLPEEDRILQAYPPIQVLADTRLKIEREMGIENLWSWMLILGVLFILFGIIAGVENPEMFLFSAIGGFSLVVGKALSNQTENYHLIDRGDQKIIRYNRFLREQETTIARFEDIVAVGLQIAKYRSGKYSKRTKLRFSFVLVRSGRKPLVLTDFITRRAPPSNVGETLASVFGVPFIGLEGEYDSPEEYPHSNRALLQCIQDHKGALYERN